MVDPGTHQAQIGYAHELMANTTVAIDYTTSGPQRKAAERDRSAVNGRRLLADDSSRFWHPTYLSTSVLRHHK